jgi:hypothetical protein
MAKTMIKLVVSALVAVMMVFGHASNAKAAEGAASHYLPGTVGNILFAQPPKPGLQTGGMLWYQTGDVGAAILAGQVSFSLDLDLFLAIPSATYTFEPKVLGGTYTVGIAVPFGYANLDGQMSIPAIPFLREASDDSFDLSDIAVTPLQLNWNVGIFSFKLAETIIAPTGGYGTSDSLTVNLGRNYWSFDTVGAVSWFYAKTGTVVDLAPGIMVNTENDKTDYKTGTEFHLDFAVNQFLSEGLAVGIIGYWYQQMSGDSGSGATLGDFKSESFGVGPGFLWIPKSAGGGLSVIGKWMHDFHAENRFDSDYFTLAAGWKF